MDKIMLTIFHIQHRKISKLFGQIDLTQLYSSPCVKKWSEENSARCDSFFSRVCIKER
jgi:aryl carrier-like protein